MAEAVKQELRDLNAVSKIGVRRGGNRRGVGPSLNWLPLDNEGRRLQSRANAAYEGYHTLIAMLLSAQPKRVREELQHTDQIIHLPLQQIDDHNHAQASSLFDDAIKAIDYQVGLISAVHDPSDGRLVLVPDTDAFLFETDLAKWKLAGSSQFDVILTPPVLSELDRMSKSTSEPLRNKAKKLIRQIKEYRRRGKLYEGVVLVNGRSRLVSLSSEPSTESILTWLDLSISDDRLIACAIETAIGRPRSEVAIVSGDINLQNKAELAQLSVLEPTAVV